MCFRIWQDIDQGFLLRLSQSRKYRSAMSSFNNCWRGFPQWHRLLGWCGWKADFQLYSSLPHSRLLQEVYPKTSIHILSRGVITPAERARVNIWQPIQNVTNFSDRQNTYENNAIHGKLHSKWKVKHLPMYMTRRKLWNPSTHGRIWCSQYEKAHKCRGSPETDGVQASWTGPTSFSG